MEVMQFQVKYVRSKSNVNYIALFSIPVYYLRLDENDSNIHEV